MTPKSSTQRYTVPNNENSQSPKKPVTLDVDRSNCNFSPQMMEQSKTIRSLRSALFCENRDRTSCSVEESIQRKPLPVIGDCYIRLERCDDLIRSPSSPDLGKEIPIDDQTKWREKLGRYLGEWNPSEYPKKALKVCSVVQETISDFNEGSVELGSVEAAYTSIAEYFEAIQGPVPTGNRPPRTKKHTKRKLKRYQYARTQDIFKKDPACFLAKHVRQGTDYTVQNTLNVSRNEVRDLYAALWKTKVPTRILDVESIEISSVGLEKFGPITASDIKRSLARIKKSTASNPDEIKRAVLLGIHKSKMLAIMFNLILATGVLPTIWKQNSTNRLIRH